MAGQMHETISTRQCLHCGNELTRKRYNGRLEDRAVFGRRKFCGPACSAEAQKREDASRSALLKRVRKYLGMNCDRCGATDGLSIHHRDRDWKNNVPENLQTLCSSCHTSLHHEAGEIVTRATERQCRWCGRACLHRSVCDTCRTRIKRHGSAFPGMKWDASSRMYRAE